MKFYIGSGLQNAPRCGSWPSSSRTPGGEHTYDWDRLSAHAPQPGHPPHYGGTGVQGVKDADVVILLSPRGKGTHTEFGMALAWGKKVYLCHGDDSLFRGDENTSTFYCLPQVAPPGGDIEAIARQVLEG